ncbi:flagellar hook-associated protein FlgK [Methylocella sp.]|uniref:flagellar hook-associated protein FlgK n=1 Tax=Methylocella sp. TaxID=1978226 RepID=UPI003784EE17
MSLSNAAAITQSGLASVTTEIATLSRNVSGASDTAYYSRKSANVASTAYGSQVVSVSRASNRAVFENLLAATAASAAQDATKASLETLSQAMGSVSSEDAQSGTLTTLIGNLSGALQYYSATPSDATAAGNVVSAAEELARRLNEASDDVQKLRQSTDQDIASAVADVNDLLARFGEVDDKIVKGLASSRDVGDLQDQRDAILKQLSSDIGVTTTLDADGGMSIYADGGATLFQGGRARAVTFVPTETYVASTVGRQVYVDGVAVTGVSAAMPATSGKIAGLAKARDEVAVSSQAQLDNIAAALIETFRESAQSGGGPDRPGLFTTFGASAMPSSSTGLAASIVVNATVDPTQGGDVNLLRDGGISDPAGSLYTYNATGAASYVGRISQLSDALASVRSFPAGGEITTSASVGDYAAAAASWLQSARASATDAADYQETVRSAASTALSNATGVNINDEMSKMLDLEQSYTASAKLLSAINDMFKSLLNGI